MLGAVAVVLIAAVGARQIWRETHRSRPSDPPVGAMFDGALGYVSSLGGLLSTAGR